MSQTNRKLTPPEAAKIRRALRELPTLEPPPRSWQRLHAELRAEAERPSQPLEPQLWLQAAGLAGVALIASLLLLGGSRMQERAPSLAGAPTSLASTAATTPSPRLEDFPALVAESAWLDDMLRQLPAQPGLMPASTASTIVELEDQIALIDAHLSLGAATDIDASYRDVLWRDRVDLMNALLQVRMAHAQRHEF